MKILQNEPLAKYTSLNVGGAAEKLIIASNRDEMIETLATCELRPFVLGFGCNILISDSGLTGTTIIYRGGNIDVNDNEIVCDAGVWWDEAVKTAIENKLWGMEMTSQIPSSVGGAIFGNIAAYGQQTSDTLSWIEAFDFADRKVKLFSKDDFSFPYRGSSIQDQTNLIILRAGFKLSDEPTVELKYDSALIIAEEIGADVSTLNGRRQTIVEARRRAGSLYDPTNHDAEHTAGSFFKNPLVSEEQARFLASFDETGKTLERIENQSRIHGGDSHRASAAHVLLAADFQRGQTWDKVRLHPNHVLKIETLPGATATEVYSVVQEILSTVKSKLDIDLETEVKLIGF